MIGRLQPGDEIELVCATDTDSYTIHGTITIHAHNYIRIDVDIPHGHPNITIETGTRYGPGITVCRDYTMEVLGTAPVINVITADGYSALIHA